jgi:restriction system protein
MLFPFAEIASGLSKDASNPSNSLNFFLAVWGGIKAFGALALLTAAGIIYALLGIAYVALNASLSHPKTAAFLAAPIVAYLAFRAYKWKKSRDEQTATAARVQVALDKAFQIIDKYAPLLAKERKKQVYIDPYGETNSDRWMSSGIPYFVDRVLSSRLDADAILLSLPSFRNLVSSYIDECAALAQPLSEGYEDSMSGDDYEIFCAYLLQARGWDATLTKKTGDQGVDIIATKDAKRLCVQCKKYSGGVGNSAVQEVVAGLAFYGGTNAIVISNSEFTPQARSLAASNNVILISHDEIANLDDLLK